MLAVFYLTSWIETINKYSSENQGLMSYISQGAPGLVPSIVYKTYQLQEAYLKTLPSS